MINKYTNQQYSGDVPLKTGDRRFAQDRIRDFYFMMDHAGLLGQDYNYPDTKFIVYGGVVSKGSGDTLNITAGVGYASFSVYVPDTWVAFPPAKVAADVAMARIAWGQQTNMAITSAVLNGASVNYVKAKYAETDSNTRARAKAPGTYSYEVVPSYTFTVDTTAPTAYEICLASFIGTTGGSFTFSTQYRTGNYTMSNVGTELTADAALSPNVKYVLNATSRLNLTLPASANVGARIIIQDKGYYGYKILQNADQQIFVMGKATIAGTTGYFQSRIGLTTIELECTTTDTTWKVTKTNDVWMMKGYAMGGFDGSWYNYINDLDFTIETSNTITATLNANKSRGTGVSSFSKGYMMGGSTGSATNVIEDLNFATETSASIAATLDESKYDGAGVNSFSKGYCMGGYNASIVAVNTIEDLNFATEASASISATLDVSTASGTGVSSFTKGYKMGGYTTASCNVIENLNFATEASASISATLPSSSNNGAAISGFFKGYIMGGSLSGAINIIQSLNFSTELSASITATLDTSNYGGTGVSSFTKGYKMGGYQAGYVAIIEDLLLSVESSVFITATLNAGIGYMAGVQGYIG